MGNVCSGNAPAQQEDIVTITDKEKTQEPKPLPEATLASTTTIGSDSSTRRPDTGTQIAESNFRYTNNNNNRSNFVANVVTMKIVYLGLYSDRLIAPDGEPIGPFQKRFEKSMKQEIAQFARTLDHRHVHVALYVGEPENSVVCIVTVVPPPDNSSMTLEEVKDKLLDKQALETELTKHIGKLSGITAVTADPIRCSVEDVFLDQWKEAATADGEVYYWSVKTRTSNWHNPMEAEEDEPEPLVPEPAAVVVAETKKLVLTFLKQDQQEQEVTFTQRPVGLVWYEGRFPLEVQACRQGSFAAQAHIQQGWLVQKVNGEDIKSQKSYNDACKIIIDACQLIPKKGTEGRSFA